MDDQQWRFLVVGDCVADPDDRRYVVIERLEIGRRIDYFVVPGEELPERYHRDDGNVRRIFAPSLWRYLHRTVAKTEMIVSPSAMDALVALTATDGAALLGRRVSITVKLLD